MQGRRSSFCGKKLALFGRRSVRYRNFAAHCARSQPGSRPGMQGAGGSGDEIWALPAAIRPEQPLTACAILAPGRHHCRQSCANRPCLVVNLVLPSACASSTPGGNLSSRLGRAFSLSFCLLLQVVGFLRCRYHFATPYTRRLTRSAVSLRSLCVRSFPSGFEFCHSFGGGIFC
jgi:hypothetical protein